MLELHFLNRVIDALIILCSLLKLDAVAAKFHEEPGQFKILIIDSIMALFRVDYSGRGELAERQQKLAQLLSRLQKIAEEYNVAIFITNQMTADPGNKLYNFEMNPLMSLFIFRRYNVFPG